MDDGLIMERYSGGGVALRLFTALTIDVSSAEHLADYGEQLAARATDARPVEPVAMHVTFAYLGDVVEEYVPLVASAMDAAAVSVAGAVAISTCGASLYGKGRVIAADLNVELLTMLDAARDSFLNTVAAYAPQADHRAWRPHLTVLRAARGGAGLELAFGAGIPQPPAATWIADRLLLHASLPSPVGRQHRQLHGAPLGGVAVQL